MIQTNFDNLFKNPVYDPALDRDRLTKQSGRIYELMIDGEWRTLSEIYLITGYPESSISAQLRHFRKEEFGSHTVNKRRKGEPSRGLWEYQLIK